MSDWRWRSVTANLMSPAACALTLIQEARKRVPMYMSSPGPDCQMRHSAPWASGVPIAKRRTFPCMSGGEDNP